MYIFIYINLNLFINIIFEKMFLTKIKKIGHDDVGFVYTHVCVGYVRQLLYDVQRTAPCAT